MSAIITTKFRYENAKSFISSVASDNLYVFLGKSDAWSNSVNTLTDSAAPAPADTIVEENDARQNMIAAKKVALSDISHIARKYLWSSGLTWAAWDDAAYNVNTGNTIFDQNFYMITDGDFKVYKCIKAGPSTSTNKPTHTNVNPTRELDGYVWKYMYTVFTDAYKFLTNNYMPVKTVISGSGLSQDDNNKLQFQIDSAGNAGKIYRYVVTSNGNGYSSNPTVTVYGNGTGAQATATVVNGEITEINVTGESGATPSYGTGYTNAFVVITDPTGNGATARAVLSPPGGHGTDPVRELGGFYVGIASSLRYSEGGAFIINNKFRQVGLLKNPYNTNILSPSLLSATAVSALREIKLSTGGGFTTGDYIIGDASDAVAYVDSYDSDEQVIRYHQNDKTGYTPFQLSERIDGHLTGSATIASSAGLLNPEINRFTGQLMFLENRAPINRSDAQIEEIKIIVEF